MSTDRMLFWLSLAMVLPTVIVCLQKLPIYAKNKMDKSIAYRLAKVQLSWGMLSFFLFILNGYIGLSVNYYYCLSSLVCIACAIVTIIAAKKFHDNEKVKKQSNQYAPEQENIDSTNSTTSAKPKIVVCKCCGANNTITGTVGECGYCVRL